MHKHRAVFAFLHDNELRAVLKNASTRGHRVAHTSEMRGFAVVEHDAIDSTEQTHE